MAAQIDVKRQGWVIIVAIIALTVAIGYIVLSYVQKQNARPSQLTRVQTSHERPGAESERYSEILDKYNRKNADDAEHEGDTYLSVLSSKIDDVPIEDTPKTKPAPPPQQIQPQVIYQQAPRRNDPKDTDDRMKNLLGNWTSQPHAVAHVSDGAAYAKTIAPATREASNIKQAAMTTIDPPAQKVVGDFEMLPALLDTDLDTDEQSVVRATIPTGKYKGAVVYAMGYKRVTNSVDMTFTYMKLAGRSYKITAKAVDQQSGRTTLSGEVNNRYFSRIILPAIAGGIGRAGQLYEQSAAQNIITPQGGVIQTYPENPSGRAVAGTILGGIGAQAGRVLASDAAQMPIKQVLIPAGTTIGVLFIGPVLATDDVAIDATGPNRLNPNEIDLGQPASPMPKMPVDYGYDYGGYNGSYPTPMHGFYPPGYYPQSQYVTR